MVDQEVVDILADIKKRVAVAQNKPGSVDEAITAPANSSQTVARHDYAGLSVLARAWDRLPPLVSNRTGSSARLELWFKAKLKTALRWFTWEQVNFNSATHQTLVEIVDALRAYEQNLTLTHNKLLQQQELIEQHRDEIARQIARQDSQLNAQRTELHSQVEALQVALNEFKSAAASEAQTRFAELINEFRARDERLLDEQRVCFKQLSLEMTESQVLEDRARRDLDARVNRLESELRSNK